MILCSQVGDIVIVEQGDDSNTVRKQNAAGQQSRSRNSLANTKWYVSYIESYAVLTQHRVMSRFCEIRYMYEEEDVQETGSKRSRILRKFFHARWLQHGSQTILQETAHSNSLFWLNECDNVPMECIFAHCDLRKLGLGDDEPPDDGENDNVFFTNGRVWLSHSIYPS